MSLVAQINWVNPNERSDGSPFNPATDMAQALLFDTYTPDAAAIAAGQAAYTNQGVGAPTGAATTFTTGQDLTALSGQHVFSVVIVDNSGNRAPASAAAAVTVGDAPAVAPPNPASGVTATLVTV